MGLGAWSAATITAVESRPLLRGAEDRGEHLLGVCAADGAIAAAAHLARDDSGPQGVLGAPVRGVKRGLEKEAEDGVEFGREMRGEAPCIGEPTRPSGQHVAQAIDIGAAGGGEAPVGHGAGRMAGARGQGRAQQPIDLRRKRMMRMVQQHGATAAE